MNGLALRVFVVSSSNHHARNSMWREGCYLHPEQHVCSMFNPIDLDTRTSLPQFPNFVKRWECLTANGRKGCVIFTDLVGSPLDRLTLKGSSSLTVQNFARLAASLCRHDIVSPCVYKQLSSSARCESRGRFRKACNTRDAKPAVNTGFSKLGMDYFGG